VQQLAYEFGKQLGLCFQVVDDLLDARSAASSASAAILALGKPANDLESGATTAPLLFALRAYPEEVLPILLRRGKVEGDSARMRELMLRARALDQTQRLAEECAEAALAALLQLKHSPAQSALVQLVQRVLTRTK
jgi:hexaprenyl-diphosphate synthase